MSKGSGHSIPPSPSPADDADERRRHRRVHMAIKARVLKGDGVEEPCLVVNISAGGALLKAVNPPGAGERVVVYIDEIGRYEGEVVRSAKHYFAVDYRGRRAKTHRTADTLTHALNSKSMRLDRRVHPRVRHDQPTVITLENGEQISCEILDISLTGASISVEPRPSLGVKVTVGRMEGKVVCRHEKGVAIVFTGPATHMEDVIENTKSPIEPVPGGPGLAPHFGKKGLTG